MKLEIERFVTMAEALEKTVEFAKATGDSFKNVSAAMDSIADGVAKRRLLNKIEEDFIV